MDDPSGERLEFLAESLGASHKHLESAISEYFRIFQMGKILEEHFWEKICGKLRVSLPASKSLWKEASYKTFHQRKRVYDLALSLQNNGYKIGFLSNTEYPAVEYFHETNLGRYFDSMVFSCAEKSVKPEKEIYLSILKNLDVKPDEAVLIEDNQEYIQGAKKIGMAGILFKDINQVKKELIALGIKLA